MNADHFVVRANQSRNKKRPHVPRSSNHYDAHRCPRSVRVFYFSLEKEISYRTGPACEKQAEPAIEVQLERAAASLARVLNPALT
jgi:hypothetical protein